MNATESYEAANKIKNQDDFVKLLVLLKKSIVRKELPELKSYEVVDGCENFAADLESWCAYRDIPYDGTPTWSLVAWIILAGVLND